jgi:hypothetical protein
MSGVGVGGRVTVVGVEETTRAFATELGTGGPIMAGGADARAGVPTTGLAAGLTGRGTGAPGFAAAGATVPGLVAVAG